MGYMAARPSRQLSRPSCAHAWLSERVAKGHYRRLLRMRCGILTVSSPEGFSTWTAAQQWPPGGGGPRRKTSEGRSRGGRGAAYGERAPTVWSIWRTGGHRRSGRPATAWLFPPVAAALILESGRPSAEFGDPFRRAQIGATPVPGRHRRWTRQRNGLFIMRPAPSVVPVIAASARVGRSR